jgi:hypothetical protein
MRIVYKTCDGLGSQRRFVGQFTALFHIRKIIPDRPDTHIGQCLRERLHKRMQHAGACTVAQYQQRNHVGWGDDPHRNRTGTG